MASRADLAAGATPSVPATTRFTAVFAERAESILRQRVPPWTGFSACSPLLGRLRTVGCHGGQPRLRARSSRRRKQRIISRRLVRCSPGLMRASPLGPALPGRQYRPREASTVGLGHPPASRQLGSVAAQVHLPATLSTLLGDARRRVADGAPDAPAPPTPPGVVGGRVRAQPHLPDRGECGRDQPGLSYEPHVWVRVSLADQTTGATTTEVRGTSLALGASVTLPQVTMRVKSSTTYVLTVQVIPPAGQTLTAGTAVQQQLQVAPEPERRTADFPDDPARSTPSVPGPRIGTHRIQGLEGSSGGREHHDHGQSQW